MREITKKDLQQYYHLPRNEAADKLGVSQTTMKRLCHGFQIRRWPYRLLSSLDKLIQSTEAQGNQALAADLRLRMQQAVQNPQDIKTMIDGDIRKMRNQKYKQDFNQKHKNGKAPVRPQKKRDSDGQLQGMGGMPVYGGGAVNLLATGSLRRAGSPSPAAPGVATLLSPYPVMMGGDPDNLVMRVASPSPVREVPDVIRVRRSKRMRELIPSDDENVARDPTAQEIAENMGAPTIFPSARSEGDYEDEEVGALSEGGAEEDVIQQQEDGEEEEEEEEDEEELDGAIALVMLKRRNALWCL